MKNKFLYTLFFFAAIVLALYACRHEILNPNSGSGNTGGGIPPATSSCSPDTAYFVNDIMPIIASNCTMSGCHDVASHADGVVLTNYTNVFRYVKPGNAGDSKLYKVLIKTGNERMPPPPSPALTSAQIALIQKWINQGAYNNNCIGRCDTAIFTFSGAVKPIMDGKCTGCHNPSNLGGNIDLSTYTAVRTVALNGKLYGSVAQQPGYSPMPKNGIKLSDCEIKQIQKWITAGSLNN
ncbi:MAG: hypothetical protein HZB42_02145 [Sphingobacteriales bacterium]|nr:hypothetical protein [Sphingobacteriales bacterium]